MLVFSMSSGPLNYCINLVKRLEYETYIAALFYPKQARSAAFTLRAFNLELAQAYHASKDRKIATARLQFWMNSIENICRPAKHSPDGAPAASHALTPATPVCQALEKYAMEHRLPEYWLKRLVSARLSSGESFATLADLERYAEDTQATLNYLTLHVLGIKEMSADMAARHLGKAITITNFIRAIPNYARRSVLPVVPLDIVERHKLSQQSLLKGKVDNALRASIFEMAVAAHSYFEQAADLRKKIKPPARVLYLHAEPLERYLLFLRNAYFNPFDKELLKLEQQRNRFLPFRMWKQHRINKKL